MKIRHQVSHFVQHQCRSFIEWVKLLFADDDDHRIVGAPTMKNVIMFVLLIMFCIAFLKVVYVMDVAAMRDIRNSPDKNFKDVYSLQIPDIPSNWMTVFLAGLGIMAGVGASKKIAEYKYGNGNGKGTVASQATVSPTDDKPAGS